MNGKGDRPRNNYSLKFRNNFDSINWLKKKGGFKKPLVKRKTKLNILGATHALIIDLKDKNKYKEKDIVLYDKEYYSIIRVDEARSLIYPSKTTDLGLVVKKI